MKTWRWRPYVWRPSTPITNRTRRNNSPGEFLSGASPPNGSLLPGRIDCRSDRDERPHPPVLGEAVVRERVDDPCPSRRVVHYVAVGKPHCTAVLECIAVVRDCRRIDGR